jgi:LuxR family maltose regulon positive regulatory protein
VARSRLTPPAAQSGEILRQDVLTVLDDSRRQVTLIAAPHGSGKTVALAQWARRLPDPSAWVSLTGTTHEGGAVACWAAIVESLALARPDLSLPDIAGALGTDRVFDRFVPELLNAVAGAGKIVLILDGLEQITDATAGESLSQFLLQLPPGMRVLLSTCHPSSGAVPLLRASGRLDEVGEEALRFSLAEAHELFLRAETRSATPERIRVLHSRLDGWAVGLRVASLGASTGSDAEVPYEVLDYVRATVLDRASAAQRDALLRASVLTALRCETVAAVAGSRAARELTSFADTSLLVRRVPDGWICHPALRAAADEQLRRIDPQLRASLQARAVQRLIDERDFVAAAECAVRAGMVVQAAECVVAAWPAGDPARLLEAVNHLDAAVSGDAAAVGAGAALACGLQRQAAAMLAFVEDVEVASALRAQLCLDAGDLEGAAVALGHNDRSQAGRDASWHSVLADIAVGAIDLWSDRPGRAIWRLEEAAAAAAQAGYTDAQIRALDLLVASAHLTADPDLARSAAREAVQVHRRRNRCSTTPAISIAYLREANTRAASEDQAPPPYPSEPLPGPHQLAFASHLRATYAARAGDQIRHRLAQSEARSFLLPQSAGPLLRSLLDDEVGVAGQSGHHLTEREAVVLRALAGPLTLREIARELHVSHNTIKSQVSSLFRKLGAHDRVGAIRAARDLGLVSR